MVGELTFKWETPNGGLWQFPGLKTGELTTIDGISCPTELNANIPFTYWSVDSNFLFFIIIFIIRDLFSRQGETVADFFCGSGSGAVAAMYAGRNSIAVDIDPEMVLLTRNRLDKMCADINDILDESGAQKEQRFLANFKFFPFNAALTAAMDEVMEVEEEEEEVVEEE